LAPSGRPWENPGKASKSRPRMAAILAAPETSDANLERENMADPQKFEISLNPL